jgi:hypothetical protein
MIDKVIYYAFSARKPKRKILYDKFAVTTIHHHNRTKKSHNKNKSMRFPAGQDAAERAFT